MVKKTYENESLYQKMGLTPEEAEELEEICLEIAELVNCEAENVQREYESLESEVEQVLIPHKLQEDIHSLCVDEQQQKSDSKGKKKKHGIWLKVAACLLCFLIPFTAFAPQTEAFRHKVYEIVMEEFDGHVRVEFKKNLSVVDNVIDEEERAILAEHYDEGEAFLYPTKIVEGYELVEIHKDSFDVDYYFKNSESKYIIFTQEYIEGAYYIDIDRGDIKEIVINGEEAIIRFEAAGYIARYHVENYMVEMSIDSNYITESEFIELIESVELKKF